MGDLCALRDPGNARHRVGSGHTGNRCQAKIRWRGLLEMGLKNFHFSSRAQRLVAADENDRATVRTAQHAGVEVSKTHPPEQHAVGVKLDAEVAFPAVGAERAQPNAKRCAVRIGLPQHQPRAAVDLLLVRVGVAAAFEVVVVQHGLHALSNRKPLR